MLPRLSFIVFGVWAGLAVIHLRTAPPKDWILFYDTGVLVVSGRTADLYPGIAPGYPFLYPPPFALLVGPLGLLSPGTGHAALVVAMSAALCASIWILHRGLDSRGRPLDSWGFVALSSAASLWMVVAGHIAAWFVLLISGALFLWMRGRAFAAGCALGLLAIKPHYCIPLLGCLVLARAWRALLGATVALVMLGMITLPLGRAVWASYFEHVFGTASQIVTTIPAWKQITLLAFWRSVFGDGRPMAVLSATVLSGIPCLVLVGMAWFKRGREAADMPRLFALTVLMLVSCNVYSFHYDGLLLTIAGAVWFLRDGDYVNARGHRAIGALILLVYAAQYVATVFAYGGVSVTGPLVAAWLIIDARELLAQAPSPRLAPVT